MPDETTKLKVFLCHAHSDKDKVRELYLRLKKDGVDAWLDQENLIPGQDWKLVIRKAVREADVVVVCLSKQFSQDGFRQKEVRLALETAMEKPEGEIFIIPARLEECENLESLEQWHWVDLFDPAGYRRLMLAFNEKASRIGVTFKLQAQHSAFTQSDELFLKNIVETLEPNNRQSIFEKIISPIFAIASRIRERVSQNKFSAIIALIVLAGGIFIVALLNSPMFDKMFLPVPLPTASLTITMTPAKPILSPTPNKTMTPSLTPTITSTSTPSLTSTLVPTPISANVLIAESDPLPQNCRVRPNIQSEIIEKIASGANLLAFGRSENSDWLFVKSENSERYCWINISGVKYQANEIARLPLGVSYLKGIEMVFIPSGFFTMGKDANDAFAECSKFSKSCNIDWFLDADGENQIYLDAFYMDRYEVTNLNYRECVTNGACTQAKQTSLSTVKDYYSNSKYNDYPVVYIDWEMAKTYCEWRGAHLPTEAQWEKAARGTDERIFPWGEENITCEYANYRKLNGDDYCKGFSTTVGNFSINISPYGIYDMAGNVWEWVSSLDKSYPYNANDGREDLSALGNRVMRGGSWIYYEYNSFVTNRNSNISTLSFEDVGFRCASDVLP